MKSPATLLLFSVSVFLGGAAPLGAQTVYTWLGTATSATDILESSNWSTVPTPDASTDIVFGPANNAQSITVGASLAFRNITFDDTTTRANYVFNGSGGAVLTLHGDVAVKPGGDVTFANTLTLALNTGTHHLAIAAGTNLSFAGAVAETGGSASIFKTGAGTLTLSGTNTLSGSLDADDGVVVLQSSSALGSATLNFSGNALFEAGSANAISGGWHVFSGNSRLNASVASALSGAAITLSGEATLQLGADNAVSGVDVHFSSSEGGTGGKLILNGHDATLHHINSAGAGLIANDGEVSAILTVDFDEDYQTFDGTIRDQNGIVAAELDPPALSLVKSGSGTLALTGANTYSGGTTFAEGLLAIDSDLALGSIPASPTPGNLTFDGGGLQATASFALHENRGIALGANGGIIDVDFSHLLTYAGAIAGNGGLSKKGGGNLLLSGVSTYGGGTTIYSGQLIVDNPVVSSSDSATGSGTVTVDDWATLQIGTGGTTGSVTGAIANNGMVIVNRSDAVSVGNITGTGALSLSGTGTVKLTGANTYSGETFLYSGSTLEDGAASTYSPASSILLHGGTLNVKANQTIGGLGDLYLNDQISPGNVVLFNAATLSLAEQGSTFTGVISGEGGLFIGASVYQTLGGLNTYDGATQIEGSLQLGADNVLPDTTDVRLTAGNASFDAYYHSDTIGSLAGVAGTYVSLGENITLVTANNTSTVFDGQIFGSDSSKFVKGGTGTLTLSGSSPSYFGTLAIQGGTVSLAADGVLSSAIDVELGVSGTLAVNAWQEIRKLEGLGTVDIGPTAGLTVNLPAETSSTFAGALTGSGELIKWGDYTSTFELSGASPGYSGTVTVNSGILAVSHADALGATAGGTTVDFGGTLELRNIALGAEPITLHGSGSMSGTGALRATGTTTHSGPITLAAWSTIVTPATADTLTLTGSIGETSPGQQLTKKGAGTLTLAGSTSTYTGFTNVEAGTLRVGAVDALPTNTTLGLSSGATFSVDFDQTIARFMGSISSAAEIAINGGTTELTIATPIGSSGGTFGGLVSGDGGLVIEGSNGNSETYATFVALTGTNNYSGGTTLSGGILAFTNGALGSGSITMDGGILRWFDYETDGYHPTTWPLPQDVSSKIVMVSGKTAMFDTASYDVTFASAIGNGTSASLAKIGGGSLTLNSANTYTGDTYVGSGTLLINQTNALRSAQVDVAGHNGNKAMFGGIGSITGELTLGANGGVGPGTETTVGTLTVGSAVFENGSFFDFKISDTVGAPGVQWGLLAVTGALTFNATLDPVTIFIDGIGGLTEETANLTVPYQWMFASAGSIQGFDPTTTFTIDGPSSYGLFSVSQTGNNLFLNFTPAAVPEPSTWALLLTGLVVIGFVARRRR